MDIGRSDLYLNKNMSYVITIMEYNQINKEPNSMIISIFDLITILIDYLLI